MKGRTISDCSFFSDIHTYLKVTLTSIAILQLSILGTLGLGIYGLLIVYSFAFFALNVRTRPMMRGFALNLAITYYLYFILAECINGKWPRGGAALLQLFSLTLILYFHRNTDEIVIDVKYITRMIVIVNLFMTIGSLAVTLFTVSNPQIVAMLPESIAAFMRDVTESYPVRMAGLGLQPNVTAGFCLVSLMACAYMFTSEKSAKWIVTAIMSALLSLYVIVIPTSSRTSMITLVAFMGVYVLTYFLVVQKDDRKMRMLFYLLLAIALLALLILAVVFMVSASARDFLLNKVVRISSLSTGSGRTDVYRAVLKLSRDNPIFGFSHTELAANNSTHVTSAHNVFLHALAFSGIPGLVLFCAYLFYTLFIAVANVFTRKPMSKENRNLCCLLLSFMVSYLVYGLAEDCSIDGMKMISVCAQLVFAFSHMIRHNLTMAESVRS